MKNKFVLIRYVLILWLLCGGCHTASMVYAYERTSTSVSWGYQPVHSAQYSTMSTSAVSTPGCHFQSTSVYINHTPITDHRSMVGRHYMRMSDDDDDDGFPDEGEGYPIGTLPDPEAPVGEPLILLVFAVLYLAIGLFRRRKPSADR